MKMDEWLTAATHEQKMEYFARKTAESTARAARLVEFLVWVVAIGLAFTILAGVAAGIASRA